jgi:glycosyltransferase involved in cell wall biosynthesis
MRVGLVIYGSIDTRSGGYLYDRMLICQLERSGHQVEIVSMPHGSYGTNLLDNLSREWTQRLRSLDVDILLQDELNHPSLSLMNHAVRRGLRYPVVSIVHHLRSSEHRPSWQNRIYGIVEQIYLRSVDGFIFNSETTRRTVTEIPGTSRSAVIALPSASHLGPAIEETTIQKRASRNGPLEILFLGSVTPRKGLHVLLRALRNIEPHRWRLTVAGSLSADERYAQGIWRQIRSAGLCPNVRMAGVVPDADLRRLMHRSHLLALPSSYEGFGIAYLEAMAFGLPVIGTTAGAAWETIANGVNGYLIPPEDPNTLGSRLESLITDRARLAAMGLAARRRFLDHPTWEESMGDAVRYIESMTRPR